MGDVEPELLVRKGLLPENLPPVFTGDKLWPALSPKSSIYQISSKAVGEGAQYNASKRGGQRRVFHIPHPIYIKEQGIFYKTHWAEIKGFSIALQALSPSQVLKRTKCDMCALLLILNCLKSV